MKTLICIPVFNGANYIKRSIDSCLNQTLKVDIWVFDNRSTDSTCEIVNQYIAKYDNIKLFINENNLGRTGNWNRCLDKFMNSDFKYIKFLFPGDEIFSNCINKIEKIFDEDKNIGAVYFPYKFIFNNGKNSIYRPYDRDKIFNSKEITKIQLSEGSKLGAIVCNVYSRFAIANHRFKLDHVSKVEFDLRVLEKHSLYYVNECLASFLKEAHNTFDSADSPWVNFEFAYILAKEHERIKKTKIFSDRQNLEIKNKYILKAINDQFKYLNRKSKFILLFFIFNNIMLNRLRSFIIKLKFFLKK